MGRTACTEPQCQYKGTLYLTYLLYAMYCKKTQYPWKCLRITEFTLLCTNEIKLLWCTFIRRDAVYCIVHRYYAALWRPSLYVHAA